MTVPRSPLAPHGSTPAELAARLQAERRSVTHLIFRNAAGEQQIRVIAPGERRLSIGRREGIEVSIGWDGKVSRLHAALELVGEDWTVVDDGLSRNGTFVNDERLRGRRRLNDGDLLTIGETVIAFRSPANDSARTESALGPPVAAGVSAAERCVLVALCRPLGDSSHGMPATNQQIGVELHLSVPAVKKRLATLFDRFGLDELPQNGKRVALAQAAIRAGVVTPGEL